MAAQTGKSPDSREFGYDDRWAAIRYDMPASESIPFFPSLGVDARHD
jgi:hypothetical protein